MAGRRRREWTTDFWGRDDTAFAAAIQPDGSIIAAGSAFRRVTSDFTSDFAVARYFGDSVGGAAPFDYDGDGSADISVFRPDGGNWFNKLWALEWCPFRIAGVTSTIFTTFAKPNIPGSTQESRLPNPEGEFYLVSTVVWFHSYIVP